jgi:hypothetical protein
VEQLSFRAVDEAEYVFAASPDVVLALISDLNVSNNVGRALGETLGSVVDSRDALVRVVDQLKSENEALRSKLSTVHLVCDRLPDQDGCRFIELENPQGESLGAEAGKWEIRPDGLAQLVVALGDPDSKRLAALLECAQGDCRQAVQIIEKLTPQAELYQQIQIAAGSLPSGWEIALRVENGCGSVDLIDPYGTVVDLDNVDESLGESIASAVAFAMSKEG